MGGCTTSSVVNGLPPAQIIVVVVVVVEYYCFLIIIIDVGVIRVSDVSYGLFYTHIKIEGFVQTIRWAPIPAQTRRIRRSPNNKAFFLGLQQQDGGTSSVTNSPGACVSLWV